jgi:hypothetical protein
VIEIGLNFRTVYSTADWELPITRALKKSDYKLVEWVKNVAMNLFVFVHNDHEDAVQGVSKVEKRLNSGVVWTHKAGQSIRMSFYNTLITFTNSHLAAGQSEANLVSRRMNFREVYQEPLENGDHVYSEGFVD